MKAPFGYVKNPVHVEEDGRPAAQDLAHIVVQVRGEERLIYRGKHPREGRLRLRSRPSVVAITRCGLARFRVTDTAALSVGSRHGQMVHGKVREARHEIVAQLVQ